MFNLRMDPYERADITSNTYNDWMIQRGRSWPCRRRRWWRSSSATFKEFPPRQTPSSFSVDQIMETLKRAAKRLMTRRKNGRQQCRPPTLVASR